MLLPRFDCYYCYLLSLACFQVLFYLARELLVVTRFFLPYCFLHPVKCLEMYIPSSTESSIDKKKTDVLGCFSAMICNFRAWVKIPVILQRELIFLSQILWIYDHWEVPSNIIYIFFYRYKAVY